MKSKNIKVIFDTNVWISFLIGKRLAVIKDYISDEKITIITTRQLTLEIQEVTSREKLQKYFPQTSVDELLDLLSLIAISFEIKNLHFLDRDPKR